MLVVSRLVKNQVKILVPLPNFLVYAVFIFGPLNILLSIFGIVYNILQAAMPNLPF